MNNSIINDYNLAKKYSRIFTWKSYVYKNGRGPLRKPRTLNQLNTDHIINILRTQPYVYNIVDNIISYSGCFLYILIFERNFTLKTLKKQWGFLSKKAKDDNNYTFFELKFLNLNSVIPQL